ncbi:ArdC-like ssDNA-binding domain-containing protein [Georgenia thermotolerans]|uniref:ImmA/IrrE family metallo-endopeptidase n=1 Tax=Georgenia thermotolerans TaxID=527326 RepID=A0A7J5UMC7_9MICO|nr:ArdC-like ssDNA-binding domain-containing protein [Georgenia thermotolerans]KAE8763431.1 ImmA/IrrE family metallo-endopeptidase [Georgenia thermotolerans]
MYRKSISGADKVAAREAKLDEARAKLADALSALMNGAEFQRAIEFAARFRSHSFNNTLLIWLAHNDAYDSGRVPSATPTYVAGYRQWQRLGRHVVKGQAGYMILAPVTARYVSDDPANPGSWRRLERGKGPPDGETLKSRLVNVRPTYVWDVSQTEGDPIPLLPVPQLLEGQAPEGLWDGLVSQVLNQGYRLSHVPDAATIGGANGLTNFATKIVSIRENMDELARCKTLAHELGHVLQGASEDGPSHRGIAEVEAESVALMTLAAHGVDSSQYTVPYVAGWANSVKGRSPLELVASTASRVRAMAVQILDRLDTLQVADGAPPGLQQVPQPSQRTGARPAPPSRQVVTL